jgi:hypothetical protein
MLSQKIRTVDGESFSVGYERRVVSSLRPGPLARLTARVHSQSLDRALIAGADPSGSPRLAARTAQLTSPRTRALIAGGLERLLRGAQGPQRRWWAVSRRDQLLANASRLHELAGMLASDLPLYARGIALLNQLLTDGSGPAYHGPGEGLARRLDEALMALQG